MKNFIQTTAFVLILVFLAGCMRTIYVTSDPPQADVRIGNLRPKTTPFSVEVGRRRYRVKAQRACHYEKKFVVGSDVTELHVTLKPVPPPSAKTSLSWENVGTELVADSVEYRVKRSKDSLVCRKEAYVGSDQKATITSQSQTASQSRSRAKARAERYGVWYEPLERGNLLLTMRGSGEGSSSAKSSSTQSSFDELIYGDCMESKGWFITPTTIQPPDPCSWAR